MTDIEETTNRDQGGDQDGDKHWVIVCNGTELGPDVKFLSESQEWGTIETAMFFATEDEAVNGAETLCPAFTLGHAESVALAE